MINSKERTPLGLILSHLGDPPPVDLGDFLLDLCKPLVDLDDSLVDLGDPMVDLGDLTVNLVDPTVDLGDSHSGPG